MEIRHDDLSDVSGVVLAGGRSSRLGRDKAFEVIGRESLVKRAVQRLAPLSEVIVVTSHQLAATLADAGLNARIIEDVYQDMGPLGGIHSALKACSTQYALVVACDMPLLNWGLLRYEIGLRNGFDAVVPRLRGLPESLHSVYSRSCLPTIDSLLAAGTPKVSLLLKSVRVRYVEEEEVDRFDPEHLSFFNVNTAVDIEKARGLILSGEARNEQERAG